MSDVQRRNERCSEPPRPRGDESNTMRLYAE